MSPLLALGLLVAGLCSSVHCLPGGGLDPEDVTPEDQHKGAPVDDHTFVSSNTDFAFSLYKQLALKTSNENVIFSPLSVSMALAFLSLGARGPTLTETLEGLKFNLTETPETEIHQGFQHLVQTLGRPSDQLQLSLGNAVFVQEQLKLLDKFREDAQALCASESFSTDFRDSDTAKKLINDYVWNKTQGKIVELFKNVSQSTVMVLVNCVYFKGGCPEGVFVSALSGVAGNSRFLPNEMLSDTLRKASAVYTVGCLRYTGDGSAPFILPDEGKTHDLEAKLLPETLRSLFSSFPRRIDELNLLRFSISSNCKLRNILSQLGIKKVFDHESDLSGITEVNKLGVSEVVHQAMLDVGKEGTEGAAATGIKMVTSTLQAFIASFGRPFLISVIHKDTQSIIFLG
uniref:Serpin domain-containing protein n=1 Tax=Phocoena sinus TaxID=42100 RepID=A0A8C9DXE9_PHOSS